MYMIQKYIQNAGANKIASYFKSRNIRSQTRVLTPEFSNGKRESEKIPKTCMVTVESRTDQLVLSIGYKTTTRVSWRQPNVMQYIMIMIALFLIKSMTVGRRMEGSISPSLVLCVNDYKIQNLILNSKSFSAFRITRRMPFALRQLSRSQLENLPPELGYPPQSSRQHSIRRRGF